MQFAPQDPARANLRRAVVFLLVTEERKQKYAQQWQEGGGGSHANSMHIIHAA